MDINYKIPSESLIILLLFLKVFPLRKSFKIPVLKSYGYIPLFLNWNRVDSWKY